MRSESSDVAEAIIRQVNEKDWRVLCGTKMIPTQTIEGTWRAPVWHSIWLEARVSKVKPPSDALRILIRAYEGDIIELLGSSTP